MADTIVYRQSELDAAISAGVRHITLCAGVFNIPKVHGVSFDRIGPVKVIVQCSRREADAAGMQFERIYPQYKPEYGIDTRVSMAVVGAISSGSGGSFASSGSGYYGSGSYTSGSYRSGSFSASFRPSGSHGSFSASFRPSGSHGSFSASFRPSGSFSSFVSDSDILKIYGYGINLI